VQCSMGEGFILHFVYKYLHMYSYLNLHLLRKIETKKSML
jgi:hypothetical protein